MMVNQPTPDALGRGQPISTDGSSVSFSPGPFQGWGDAGKQPFMIEVDAKPLASLVEDARNGVRVYEFMTIDRPGDIYSYLRLKPIEVTRWVADNSQLLKPRWVQTRGERGWEDGYFPFDQFDEQFRWAGDDTTPEAECWLRFRTGRYWEDVAIQLLAWVKDQQAQLRADSSPLIAREIGLIDHRRHRRDFISVIERRCLAQPLNVDEKSLPAVVLEAVAELIKQEDIRSVSALHNDFKLWQVLCNEQLRRAEATGLSPQATFRLSGPDSGLSHVPYDDWGAEVHIPYMGICMADLFLKPYVGFSFPARDKEDGELVAVFGTSMSHFMPGNSCRYVLTPGNLGELKCATLREIGEGWVLYKSRKL